MSLRKIVPDVFCIMLLNPRRELRSRPHYHRRAPRGSRETTPRVMNVVTLEEFLEVCYETNLALE